MNNNFIDNLRKYKICNLSIIDFIFVLLVAFFINYFLNKYKINKKYKFLNLFTIFVILIILGIIIHKILNIDTMLGYYLVINDKHIRL